MFSFGINTHGKIEKNNAYLCNPGQIWSANKNRSIIVYVQYDQVKLLLCLEIEKCFSYLILLSDIIH